MNPFFRFGFFLLTILSAMALSAQAPQSIQIDKNVTIPRLEKAPELEDFLQMKPSAEWEGKLAKVDAFIQRDPKDGSPATQATHAYLGYDQKNFYVVFVCFDSEPKSVRARLARRDTIGPEDDEVQIYLDTFDDKLRAYGFMTNPRGVQFDYLWTEQNGYDTSFDTLWQSRGQVTEQGWVAIMSIPFKSMRFPARPAQKWGLLLQRVIPRTSENVFWPRVSTRISGRLNQEGTVTGLADISPGRNIQFIPYGVMRTFRAPDLRDPSDPRFSNVRLRGDIGLDTKMVIKDSYVLDIALNPDFSQVESDEPQVTVNQRFEVFFPEKRPFFLENANFFDTPINMLFTRRIADPQVGARLTGKKGPYAVGVLFADDQSPGRRVADNDPLRDTRAYFGVGRISREFLKQNSVGVMYTHRAYEDSYNSVVGVDSRLKFGKNWRGNVAHVRSKTRFLDKTEKDGHSSEVFFDYTDRKFGFNTLFNDTSEDFLTQTGFFRRPDFRRFSNFARYNFRPEGKRLISHGPAIFQLATWDHRGVRLEHYYNANYRFQFQRNTEIGTFINAGQNRLRPADFSILTANRDYRNAHTGFFFFSTFFKQLTLNGEISRGTDINYVPVSGGSPVLTDSDSAFFAITVKPISQLTVDNTFIMTRLRDRPTGSSVFNNHIIRSKWNYQFTRQLSLRTIFQYNTLLANPNFTALNNSKGFNTDVLVTWLLHPGTAVYVGYNTNLQNPDPTFNGPGATPNRFINDGRQVFIKASYLFRY
ncbi:MAG TPA: DUF5916 domain-containing protein [Terriglobales bacterium]|nr:DUF5916 domain-containing protein [Terriglobales bacterium]